jgi:hypothetical protein
MEEHEMRIIAGLVGLFALLMGGAAVAAVNRKQQIVPIDDEDANDVALVAIFGPVMFHSTATAFRGGTLDCWYGGGIVDLRDATLDPGGAHLEIKTVFGGAQILVPDAWRVESTVAGLGAAQDVRAKADRPVTAPLLTLSGFAILGGIGVTSTIDEETLEQVTEAVEEARHAKDEAQAELHAAQTEAASSI